jgi:Zn finger protein HypA/HybF involved in hydrogenase expression
MNYEKENLEKLVASSNSYSEVTKKLGLKNFYGNRETVKKYINLYNINIAHFGNYNYKKCGRKKINLPELLTINSNVDNRRLKERLVKESLLDYKCCECGNTGEWNGKSITLQLDHINGVNNDNRLENLRFLCPNCHSQTTTYGGKNLKLKPNKKRYFCDCGVEISNGATTCIICSAKKQRKVERPSREILIIDIENLGYVGTGKKYGVSDNAIRKWLK